jgi:hypothetical protein
LFLLITVISRELSPLFYLVSERQSEGGGPEDLYQDPQLGLVMRCNTGRRLVKCYRVLIDTVYVSLYERRQPEACDAVTAGDGGEANEKKRRSGDKRYEEEGGRGKAKQRGVRKGGDSVLVESEEEHNSEHPYCRYEHIFVLDQSRLDADIGDKYDEEDSY